MFAKGTKRPVFFVSDSTGVTAETLGHALLTQFEGLEYQGTTLPFADNVAKIKAAMVQINRAAAERGLRPIVFATLAEPMLYERLIRSNAFVLDIFNVFLPPLEAELSRRSSHASGRSHAMASKVEYDSRIGAINFAMQHDDGASTRRYQDADLVLIGVSRSGKTPTCLYLALQFAVHAANYPITEEDLGKLSLPVFLKPVKDRTYGLTIDPQRLHQIRTKRLPGSQYASLTQCQKEVQGAERLFADEAIPYLSTTTISIEEIGSRILQALGIKRRLF
ncbi:MAG: posphoenolpyruvate synthetase regulatory kinase/phosphorylase PpsR [Gammaproteobacteria bacterium]